MIDRVAGTGPPCPGAAWESEVPTIVFEGATPDQTAAIDIDGCGRLVDAADEALAPVPFSCRAATCGSCVCRVLEGTDLLEPAEADETELLDLMGAAGDSRLVCQARYRKGPGTVRVRSLGALPTRGERD